MSVDRNLHHAHVHHESLMHQWVAMEDAPEMTQHFDSKRECGANCRGGAGPQDASGCSLTDAAPGYGEDGGPRKVVAETLCSVSGASGAFEIFT